MIPRLSFAHLPTPIEALPRLSEALHGPRILVKRDDLTGLAFGGNKTRKLEFVLAAALANGSKTLITTGAAQSNHCRQTAAAAAHFGLRCILILSGDAQAQPTANLTLDQLFGAEIIWTERSDRQKTMNRVFQQAWDAGQKPYLIPLGASDPIGTLGYDAAFSEFLEQETPADWIVVASSSGGTQAGLVLGARRSDWKGHVLGISIDEPHQDLSEKIAMLATLASDYHGQIEHFEAGEIEVNDQYLGQGYGVMGEPEKEAIRLFAKTEGLLLDPVYTGRAAAGMVDLIRRGFFKPNETVLFWHTGGTPALFASAYQKNLLA